MSGGGREWDKFRHGRLQPLSVTVVGRLDYTRAAVDETGLTVEGNGQGRSDQK